MPPIDRLPLAAMEPDGELPEAAFRQQWDRLLAALADAGAFVQHDALAAPPFMQAQSVRYLLRILRGMELTGLEWDDAAYPRLTRMFNAYLPYPNANPDCVYFFAKISDDSTYRIHGKAGSARILEVQIMDGHFPAGPDHNSLGTITNLKGDANGDIEVILSRKYHAGNWMPLKPGTAWLYLRQYYYDWENELPAELVIERDGAVYPPPLPSPRELKARVDRIIGWIPSWYRHLRSRVSTYYTAPANVCAFSTSHAGMDDMQYGKGHIEFDPGECVILEFRPPECPYWSFQIMNDFWETMEFDVRQTSLNGHQARLDADGVFRAVIAVDDPGVDNWLDPVGNYRSLICARVLKPATKPEVTMRTVALAALCSELPESAVFLDPAERSEQLRRRVLATSRRYRE